VSAVATTNDAVTTSDNVVRRLSASPAIVPMLARGAVASLPLGSRVLRSDGDPLHTTLVLDDVALDRDRLARYARLCGFDLSDMLPATYPHVLAFGLQLAQMSNPRFPLPVVGLVHIANQIEQRRPIGTSEPLSLQVSLEPIEPHPRGRSFTICTEVRCEQELVWTERSTMLHRGDGDESAAVTANPPSAAGLARNAEWQLPADLGRRYAAVSGDRNPIHLRPLTARLFGFRQPIAHGMWTTARSLAGLGPELPESYRVRVAFKRPILLPATVTFAEATAARGALAFGVRDADDDTPHLDGLIAPLS
jgi:MaoC like domain